MSHCQEEQHVLRTVENVEPTTSSQVSAEAAPTRPAVTEDDEFINRGDGSERQRTVAGLRLSAGDDQHTALSESLKRRAGR